jgi:hypothetical protein
MLHIQRDELFRRERRIDREAEQARLIREAARGRGARDGPDPGFGDRTLLAQIAIRSENRSSDESQLIALRPRLQQFRDGDGRDDRD